MQVEHEFAGIVANEFEFMVELNADDHPRSEVEPVIVDRRVLEAGSTRQFRVPDVQALFTLQLNLHKAETMQGDFVRHYVIDNHPITAFMVSTNGSQKKRAQPAMLERIMAAPVCGTRRQ
jgi:hypothetical protein